MSINKGDLLISYPYLEDDYFFRSVICMMEHNSEGSFGLIINKKMPYKIGEVLPILSHIDNALYMGGPVDTSALFFLHPYKDLKDTIPVCNELYWNGDIHELKDMFELKFAHPKEVRFFLGYSGWSSGQIEEEIQEKSWIVGSYNYPLIMDESHDDLIWRKSIETLGKDFEHLAHYPIDPNLN